MGIRTPALLALLGVLATVAYTPSLSLPFISDDYVQIDLGRQFGPVSGWSALAGDVLYRARATSLVLTYWTERAFGLNALAFNSSSLLLHVLNTWLVLALGLWRPIGWRVAAVAAASFAVQHAHQEAVIWYSALPELLVFFFSVSSFLLWVLWLQDRDRKPALYAGSMACFLLALLSKESAVVVVGLLAMTLAIERVEWRKRVWWLVPYAAIAAVYAGLIFTARESHLHFNDAGTFALDAPFWSVLARSTGRLLWFWGLVSLIALAAWRERRSALLLAVAGAWMAITFLPYSFLTYMPFVPSRHTYWASVGRALIIAAGVLAFSAHYRKRWATALLALVIVAHNYGYLWLRKRPQFVERARPTEMLVDFARRVDGPIYLHCFPYGREVAELALEVRLNRQLEPAPTPSPDPARVFCWFHGAKPPPMI
ncbi:MAG: hypothetical protein ACRD96_24030 [Bryobacteraceae bacterium]